MNSRYLIIETLQESAGTRVSLAMDSWSRNKVIIKQVRPQAHPAWKEQFRTEVKILKMLCSQWIPRLIESEDTVRGCWLCEEYIEGISLRTWMDARPSRREKREIFLQILSLISLLHDKGYLYMDLKPENILVRSGHAFLIDFNACLPVGSLRPVLISQDSLPPEALTGKAMDERADQIGLGRLWLALMGPSAAAWTALAKNPEKRFRTLDAFAEVIRSQNRPRRIFVRTAALCLVPGILSLFVSVPSASAFAPAQNASDLPSVSELYRNIQKQKQPLKEGEWIAASKAAASLSHLGLAGWLYDHPPETENASIHFYRFLQGLMLGTDLKKSDLDQLLEELPDQLGWTLQLETLLNGLIQKKILVDQEKLKQLLSSLEAALPVEKTCIESVMNYLLLVSSMTGTYLPLSETLSLEFQEKTKDLYGLYRRAAP